MKKSTIKFTIFIILLIAVIFSINYFNPSDYLTTEKIREPVSSYGMLAPLAFIIFYVIATILFLPGILLSVSSGIIFGAFKGTIYTIIGATIGSTLAFLIARYFARDFTEELINTKLKKLKKYDKELKKHGFITVLFLRLIPLFPFNGLNFALGLTKVKLKDYFLATLIGIIPGTFAYVYLGDSLAELSIINIIGAIIFVILLALILPIYKKYKSEQ